MLSRWGREHLLCTLLFVSLLKHCSTMLCWRRRDRISSEVRISITWVRWCWRWHILGWECRRLWRWWSSNLPSVTFILLWRLWLSWLFRRNVLCTQHRFFLFPKGCHWRARNRGFRLGAHFLWFVWRYHNRIWFHIPRLGSWELPWSQGNMLLIFQVHRFLGLHLLIFRRCFRGGNQDLWWRLCIKLKRWDC